MLNRLQDVFKSFQKHEVRYLVIGGVAFVLHGVPRATFDVDIPSPHMLTLSIVSLTLVLMGIIIHYSTNAGILLLLL